MKIYVDKVKNIDYICIMEGNMKAANNEKDIKDFISKYPWLLDLKYENVPELDKNGLEYYIEGKGQI